MSSCIAEVGKTYHELSTGNASWGVTRFDKDAYLERRNRNDMVPGMSKENDVSSRVRVLTGEADDSIVQDKCSIYVAKSIIPNSNFGAFAGVGIQVKESFESDSSEIVIPLIDIRKHFPTFDSTILSNYLWRSYERGAQFESDKVDIMQPNLGMVTNGHLALYKWFPNTLCSGNGAVFQTERLFQIQEPTHLMLD